MRLVRRVELLGAVAALGLAACSYWPHHLIFYQNTVVGVDVSTDTQANTVHAMFGYDRNTGAYIPKVCVPASPSDPVDPTPDPKGTPAPDPQACPSGQTQRAMSVLSKSDVVIGWFGNQTISERFATGEAARNIAVDDSAIRKLSIVSTSPSPTATAKGNP